MNIDATIQLLTFLRKDNPEVRKIAISHVLSFTPASSGCIDIFKANASSVVADLKELCKDTPEISHDALAAFINLSKEREICEQADDGIFLNHLVNMMTDPKNPLADLATMLLSNLSKYEPIAAKLLNASRETIPPLCPSKRVLDILVALFFKGVGKAYNKEAEYHFVASVLADISTTSKGREYFLSPSYDNQPPLAKIVCFTEHSNIIRRGGAITILKNCCFDVDTHEIVLAEDGINALPYLLLPLCGPEEFEEDDMEGMPEDIQLLPPDKTREVDSHLRLTLLEAALLLTTSRKGRDILRKRKVYPVIRALHLVEKEENVSELAEKVVNMLMRDEDGDHVPGNENVAAVSSETGFEEIE